MVVFVCEGCNESLKKAAVERHACFHRGVAVTCVDCSLTFAGRDFAAHTACVSEADKYEKGATKAGAAGARPPKAPKRDPQHEWTAFIARAAAQQPPGGRLAGLLGQLVAYTNVPRKLKPFINFARNSLRQHNDALLTEVFGVVLALVPLREKPAEAAVTPVVAAALPAAEPEAEAAEMPPRKRKRAPEDTADSATAAAFKMKSFLLTTVSGSGSVKLSKLRKRAIAAGVEAGATAEAASDSFEKRLAALLAKGRLVGDGAGRVSQAT